MFLNERHIFSCIELKDIYDKYLEPFLGAQQYYVDKEKAIMNEVAYLAEWEMDPNAVTISKLLEDSIVVSDVVDTFLMLFNRSITQLVNHINTNVDYVILNPCDTTRRFNANIEIVPGYLVVLSATIYNGIYIPPSIIKPE